MKDFQIGKEEIELLLLEDNISSYGLSESSLWLSIFEFFRVWYKDMSSRDSSIVAIVGWPEGGSYMLLALGAFWAGQCVPSLSL